MTEDLSSLGKVLFVDDNDIFRDLIATVAKLSGITDYEIYEDAEPAVARIKGLDEAASAIFSDGLNGGWRDVIDAAKEARIPAFVVSTDTSIQPAVEEAGATFLPKQKMVPGVLKPILAGLQT